MPGGTWLLDIRVYGDAAWTAATRATLIVGDAADPDGWYTAVDLQGRRSRRGRGARLRLTGRLRRRLQRDPATGLRAGTWSAAERVITASVTTVAIPGSTAGRTRVLVTWTDTAAPTPALFA